MRNTLLLLILLVAGVLNLHAQQEHHYTQFMYNKLLINPGYAGARGIPFVTAIYRNQWLGFDGAPQSALVSFNSNFLSPRVGVGVTLSNNQVGLMRDFQANLAYSYDLIAGDQVSLRVHGLAPAGALAMCSRWLLHTHLVEFPLHINRPLDHRPRRCHHCRRCARVRSG